MHGSVHDFVVIKTVKDGNKYPTGHGGGALVETILPGHVSLSKQPVFSRVLDIGSLDINGNMRDYNYCGAGPLWVEQVKCDDYVGIDLVSGPNVDFVMNSHDLKSGRDYYDLVLCLSMLEHDTDPLSTIEEAYRVLKIGQPFLLTTVDNTHPEHKHLGGGDKETYNYITEEMLAGWFKKAGFKNAKVYHVASDLFVEAIK
jgi:SAM-dependent methyltransferase